MKKPKDIREFTPGEYKIFIDSFDIIMADCDGVIWINEDAIAGALEALKMLQDLGKKVIFVSNNATRSVEGYLRKFQDLGFEASPEQIVIPSLVVTWYLKKINFQGRAFVIGTKPFINALSAGGINVVTGPNSSEEAMEALKHALRQQPDIKAVIMDFDMNINYLKMMQTLSLLEREDVLFLTGTRDERIPISKSKTVLGPGPFIDIVIKQTGRMPVECAKPSEILKEYLFENCTINDPERCIFVGDSLAADMKFAALCGFSKLWVSSGVDNVDSINSISEAIPDYYLPNLGVMPSFK